MMQTDELTRTIESYLKSHNAMSLATAHENRPHAASVFYLSQGLELYFLSSPSSQHGQDLTVNNRASATINEDYGRWSEIKGLQLEGHVVQLGNIAENTEIAAAFKTKFSDVSDFLKAPDELPIAVADKVAKVQFFKFQPSKISYIDNSLGFGHREELQIS
jgi:hypothetical protein